VRWARRLDAPLRVQDKHRLGRHPAGLDVRARVVALADHAPRKRRPARGAVVEERADLRERLRLECSLLRRTAPDGRHGLVRELAHQHGTHALACRQHRRRGDLSAAAPRRAFRRADPVERLAHAPGAGEWNGGQE